MHACGLLREPGSSCSSGARGNDALRGSASLVASGLPGRRDWTATTLRRVGAAWTWSRILLSFEAGAPCIAPRATRSRSIPSCLQSLALIRSEFRGNRLAIALEATQAHREKLHPAAHRPVRAEVGFGGCRRFPPCFRSLVELLEEAVEVQALDEGSLAAMVEAAWLVGRRTDHAPGTLEARHGACGESGSGQHTAGTPGCDTHDPGVVSDLGTRHGRLPAGSATRRASRPPCGSRWTPAAFLPQGQGRVVVADAQPRPIGVRPSRTWAGRNRTMIPELRCRTPTFGPIGTLAESPSRCRHP